MLRRFLLCCLLLLPFFALAQNGAVSEYSLKAVLLLRLPQFIYWPQSDKPPPTINLCVQGSNPFGGLLQQVAHSPGVATEIRFLDNASTYAGCDLLFVSRSESTQLDSLLQRTEGHRLVTVSDIPGFVRAGGMVELVVAGDRIGLALNRRGAKRHGFDFNAQLLNLAQRVEQ